MAGVTNGKKSAASDSFSPLWTKEQSTGPGKGGVLHIFSAPLTLLEKVLLLSGSIQIIHLKCS